MFSNYARKLSPLNVETTYLFHACSGRYEQLVMVWKQTNDSPEEEAFGGACDICARQAEKRQRFGFCCVTLWQVRPQSEIVSLSMTEAHWKRRIESPFHFVFTNKSCCLQAAISNTANFLEIVILLYNLEVILSNPTGPLEWLTSWTSTHWKHDWLMDYIHS